MYRSFIIRSSTIQCNLCIIHSLLGFGCDPPITASIWKDAHWFWENTVIPCKTVRARGVDIGLPVSHRFWMMTVFFVGDNCASIRGDSESQSFGDSFHKFVHCTVPPSPQRKGIIKPTFHTLPLFHKHGATVPNLLFFFIEIAFRWPIINDFYDNSWLSWP